MVKMLQRIPPTTRADFRQNWLAAGGRHSEPVEVFGSPVFTDDAVVSVPKARLRERNQ